MPACRQFPPTSTSVRRNGEKDSPVKERGFEPPVPFANESTSPAEREVPQRRKSCLESVVYPAGDREFQSPFLRRRVT
jgi:hypothetical protein